MAGSARAANDQLVEAILGELAFLVRPRRAQARYATPRESAARSFHHLRLHFQAPSGLQLTIRLRPA